MRVFVGIPRVGADERKEVVVDDLHRPDHADHQHGDNELREHDPVQTQSVEAGQVG